MADKVDMIPVDTRAVVLDTWAMTATEVGSMMLHVFDCWKNGTVGECCPEWVRREWGKAVSRDFRGYQKPGPVCRYYGAEWPSIRSAILARDGHCCTKCNETHGLHVHHIQKLQSFHGDTKAANRPDNLITLCSDCHLAAHGKVRRS